MCSYLVILLLTGAHGFRTPAGTRDTLISSKSQIDVPRDPSVDKNEIQRKIHDHWPPSNVVDVLQAYTNHPNGDDVDARGPDEPAPKDAPTQIPTEAPTEAPTQAPTEQPTDVPTDAPTEVPTEATLSDEPGVDLWPQIGDQQQQPHAEVPGDARIEIWAATDGYHVNSACATSSWWAEAKGKVVEWYTKFAKNGAVFYDDTGDNVAAAARYSNVHAKKVSKAKIGFLADNLSLSMWDDLAAAADSHENETIAIFDFDLTLSDVHSGGHLLDVHDFIATCNQNREPCFKDQAEIEGRLTSVARTYKKLVILSRGDINHLIKAFSFMGFDVVLSGHIKCPARGDDWVSAWLSDAPH